MSTTMERAWSLADDLVRKEMIDAKMNKPEAMRNVAAGAGLLPGTLENVLRRRLKNVESIVARLESLAVARLERQAEETRRELVARVESGRADDPSRLARAAAALDEAARLLAE